MITVTSVTANKLPTQQRAPAINALLTYTDVKLRDKEGKVTASKGNELVRMKFGHIFWCESVRLKRVAVLAPIFLQAMNIIHIDEDVAFLRQGISVQFQGLLSYCAHNRLRGRIQSIIKRAFRIQAEEIIYI